MTPAADENPELENTQQMGFEAIFGLFFPPADTGSFCQPCWFSAFFSFSLSTQMLGGLNPFHSTIWQHLGDD